MPPNLDENDYCAALLALLPTGPVWPRDPSSVLGRLALALALTASRLHARGNDALAETFPASTGELLSEWESSLGLPDDCDPSPGSVDLRRARAVSRFAARGGQSVPYLIGVAAQLGYTITITEGPAATEAFTVNAGASTVTYARAGSASAGDPLASWGNDSLECAINRVKPAHTTVTFVYA